MKQSVVDALNRLAKWRAVFAGWQLGTRSSEDPECQAVRDHREHSLLVRAELTALAGLLIDKGIITMEEFEDRMEDEAEALMVMLERRFPGFRATDDGIAMDSALARETTKNWRR